MLQKLQGRMVSWLESVYKTSIHLNYIPQIWKRVKVVFIPKPGRRNHEKDKDFTPISLTSYLLKILERLLDFHIRHFLGNSKHSKAQHAYIKGRSTEAYLHEVVGTIEKSIHYKQYTLTTFLDMVGAFINITIEATTQSLVKVKVSKPICEWIKCICLGTDIISYHR